jgi:hypothetical protein
MKLLHNKTNKTDNTYFRPSTAISHRPSAIDHRPSIIHHPSSIIHHPPFKLLFIRSSLLDEEESSTQLVYSKS